MSGPTTAIGNETAEQQNTAPLPRFLGADDGRWHCYNRGAVRVWISGLPVPSARERLVEDLVAASSDFEAMCGEVSGCRDHFAVVVEDPNWLFAAVDHIRSIPVYYGRQENEWRLAANAGRLREALDVGFASVDPGQAEAFSMSGFTFPGRTLLMPIRELKAGECVILAKDTEPRTIRYYSYQPWQDAGHGSVDFGSGLKDAMLSVFERMVESLDGRPVVIPLSAGLDSRLVLSALKHLRYPDIHLFAYGLPGNFEARASREIAEYLNFPWTFVPLSAGMQDEAFKGDDFADYMRFSESYASLPFQQEFLALRTLIDTGKVPGDSVIVNGQSGDFISGNHIPKGLPAGEFSFEQALIDKHFSLWSSLKTPKRCQRIRDLLADDLREIDAPVDDKNLGWACYEASEYQGRQAKYVANGQRLYEFFGYEWRLPLWDREFVEFWQRVPLDLKLGQALYRRVLTEWDLAGVWKGREYPPTVSPVWIRPLRLAAKAAFAPFGRAAWHRFEKNWFEYWMDVVGNYAVVPYETVRRDGRGHRNAISWHVEAYLRGIGLGYDGLPLDDSAA